MEQNSDLNTAVVIDASDDRYKGWMMFKTPLKNVSYPLNYKESDLSYSFTICDFNCRFVMPSSLELIKGEILYKEGERKLGVFRFPRDGSGNYVTPIAYTQKDLDKMMGLSESSLLKIISSKKPLTFNAFKIEQYGFELADISKFNIKEIKDLTDNEYISSAIKERERIINMKIKEIKKKILLLPNYLLILKNVLNRHWKSSGDVGEATNNIIHI